MSNGSLADRVIALGEDFLRGLITREGAEIVIQELVKEAKAERIMQSRPGGRRMTKIRVEQIIACDGEFCGKCVNLLASINQPDGSHCGKFGRVKLEIRKVGGIDGSLKILRCQSCFDAEVKE